MYGMFSYNHVKGSLCYAHVSAIKQNIIPSVINSNNVT